jgi:ElaB/YqjD/DUF883 family membrane-anchored ribosome-binding protein
MADQSDFGYSSSGIGGLSGASGGDLNNTQSFASASKAPSLERGIKEIVNDYAASFVKTTNSLSDDIIERLESVPQVGANVVGRVNRHARANPWMHIGIVAAGFLAVGWYLGRRLTEDEFPQIKGLAVYGDDEADEDIDA